MIIKERFIARREGFPLFHQEYKRNQKINGIKIRLRVRFKVCVKVSSLDKMRYPLKRINNGIAIRESESRMIPNHHDIPPKKSGLPLTASMVWMKRTPKIARTLMMSAENIKEGFLFTKLIITKSYCSVKTNSCL